MLTPAANDFAFGATVGGLIESLCGAGSRDRILRPIYGFGAAFANDNFLVNELLVLILEGVGGEIIDPERKMWDYSGMPLTVLPHYNLICGTVFAGLMTLYARYIRERVPSTVAFVFLFLLILDGARYIQRNQKCATY